MKKLTVQIGFYASLLFIWQAIYSAQIWPPYLFPSPVQVLDTLVWGFTKQNFLFGLLISIKRILIGYGLGVFFGIILGFCLSRNKWVEATLGSLVLGLQTLPSICWLPAAILWFGLNDGAIVFVVLIGSLLAVTIATDDGIKNISPIYAKAGRTMGASGFILYRDVVLPAAFPNILTGLKQGWSFAWRALLAGELLFVGMGLGHLLQMGRELNDISQVFAVMIVIVFLGLLVDRGIFSKIEAHVRERWGLDK